MKKRICALMALLLAGVLTGCSAQGGAETQLDEQAAAQLAVRMAKIELTQEDAERYAPAVGAMSDGEFDALVANIVKKTSPDTDWSLLQRNFACVGAQMELPEQLREGEDQYFVMNSFSIQRSGQTMHHLYLHLYSTWFEMDAKDTDRITMYFDSELLDYTSGIYTSDEIVYLVDDSRGEEGVILFNYEDRRATDRVPFDGDDRSGEVLVSVYVEPNGEGEAFHGGTLNHTGGKQSGELTLNNVVPLS